FKRFLVADDLAMGTHQTPQLAAGKQVRLSAQPTQQTLGRLEGHVGAEQTGPLLHLAGNEHAVMSGQGGISRQMMLLFCVVVTDLTFQVDQADPRGYLQASHPITLNVAEGEKAPGSGLPAVDPTRAIAALEGSG